MRPASLRLGTLGRSLVFLLPGNPVSALCAYDFFAGRAIRALGGRQKGWPYVSVKGTLTRKISSPIGRLDYARVKIEDGRVEPLSVSGASLLSSTTRADGFVIVDDDRKAPRRRHVDAGFMREPPSPKASGGGAGAVPAVLDRDEAERRFRAAVDASPRRIERVGALPGSGARPLRRRCVAVDGRRSTARTWTRRVWRADTFGASEEVSAALCASPTR